MILLDTDVLLDVALGRPEHSWPAAALLRRLELRPKSAFVAWHSLANLYHLVRPLHGRGSARQFVDDLTQFVLVAPTDTEDVPFAAGLDLADFEDSMQVAAARACGARALVTRNLRAFRHSSVPAIPPTEALDLLP